jgi:membrane-associated phospholipid phosphatase
VTDFADGGTVLPVAAAILAVLLAYGERRQALTWALAVGLVLGVILALKFSLTGCLPPSPLACVRSPSGHTASAAVVYGGLATVLRRAPPPPALPPVPTPMLQAVLPTLALSLVVAGVIGGTRVLLRAHTPPEALLGGGIGVLGAGCLAAAWPRAMRPELLAGRAVVVSAVVAVLVVALHGGHWSAEQLIRRTAPWFWPLRPCGG